MKISAYQSIARPRIPIPIMHSTRELEFILGVLHIERPELIIELGTCWGGLTLAMNQTLPNSLIYSFDIEYRLGRETLNSFNKNVVVGIVPELTTEPLPVITTLLKEGWKVLLYSDNGDKVKEFSMYLPFLAKGDIIGVHDYVGATRLGISALVRGLTPITSMPDDLSISCRLWRVV